MFELIPIGTIESPYKRIEDCPRNVVLDGDISSIMIFDKYQEGLMGLNKHEYIQVLYWLDKGKRDVHVQKSFEDNIATGTFALRSPNRPNPIGSAVVKLLDVSGSRVTVRGLDCLDKTPVLDIKPAFITELSDGKVAL